MAKKNTSISIDEEILSRTELQCKKERRSVSGLIELLLEEYLNKNQLSGVSVNCGEYNISEHPDLPDGRKVVWVEHISGEGMTMDVKEVFDRDF